MMLNCEEPKLGIVVPCYNEEESLGKTIETLTGLLDNLKSGHKISKESFIYLVDDGSADNTFQIIKDFHSKNNSIKALRFTKNFGNQNAILAGMLGARELGADCTVTIDADLQQDENAIYQFLEKYREGYEIVLGVRQSSQKAGIFKKITSSLFYKTMEMLGAKLTPNHSEYRLCSKKTLDILSQYGEYSLFLREVISEIGLKTAYVPYKTKAREFGTTKFSMAKLCGLALNGITSSSIIPLRFVAVLGIFLALFSFGFGLEVLYEKFFLNNTPPGWTTIVVSVCFFSGIQIFCIGIIGEYLGQIFREVKGRPRYIKDTELR